MYDAWHVPQDTFVYYIKKYYNFIYNEYNHLEYRYSRVLSIENDINMSNQLKMERDQVTQIYKLLLQDISNILHVYEKERAPRIDKCANMVCGAGVQTPEDWRAYAERSVLSGGEENCNDFVDWSKLRCTAPPKDQCGGAPRPPSLPAQATAVPQVHLAGDNGGKDQDGDDYC